MRKNVWKQIGTDLWGILRINLQFVWYCYIRRQPERMRLIIEREMRELGL